MVPQEHISWMSEQPEDVLSARNAQVFDSQFFFSFLYFIALLPDLMIYASARSFTRLDFCA